jgi:hypothetical protein
MMKGLKLWWMQQRLKASNKSYSKYVEAAKGEEREFRISEAINVRDVKRDEILQLRSMLLSDQAESLGLPVPPLSDKESWESGWWPETIRLTVKAQSQLRQAIRKERQEKWSFAAFILKDVAVPLIGSIGAIMGLLSLIHSFKSK